MKWNDILHAFYEQLFPKDRERWLFERTACDTSFFYFITHIIDPCFGTTAPPASLEIHTPTCDLWQSPLHRRKASYKPRDWRKSTYYTMGSGLWEYLQNNEHRILFASQKEKRPSDWLLWIEKQVMNNKKLRWTYPELQVVTPSWKNNHKWSSTQAELPSMYDYPDPTFQVIGITGGAHGGHHTIIYPDDLVGEKGMESEAVMEDACRWIDNVDELLVERDPSKPNPSEVRISGTHWANGDMGHYVQQKYTQYYWHITPCLKDSSLENQDHIKWIQNPNVGDMESNWPEAHSTEGYLEDMANPEREMVFWSQLMNNPGGGGSGLNKFNIKDIRYYHTEEKDDGTYLVTDDEHPKTFKESLIPWYGIIDPGGFSETKLIKKGSNNAILIGGQPTDSIIKFVRYTFAGKMQSTKKFRDMVFELHAKYALRQWRIETFAQQGYIHKNLREDALERSKSLPISPAPKNAEDVSDKAKHRRMQAVMPVMERGEIYLHVKMRKLIAEITSYPNIIGGCDLLDCLGWLNQLYWSRKKLSDMGRQYKRDYYHYLESRSSTTGY